MAEELPLPGKTDDLLPIAEEVRRRTAIREAEEADEHMRRTAVTEAEKRTLIEKLSRSSGLSEDEKIKLVSTVIQRAIQDGLSEIQLYRFSSFLCIDNGRALHRRAPGWEKTLTGIPLRIYQLWSDYLEARGCRVQYRIVDFIGGLPGDIRIVLAWDEADRSDPTRAATTIRPARAD